MSAGYSKTPSVQKLGIKVGHKIAILHAPPDYAATLGELPFGVTVGRKLKENLDFVQIFVEKKQDLEELVKESKKCLKPGGAIWISWPKRSSEVQTDVSESDVRRIGLESGLVDVKISAIDNTWSGLKFVRRLKDR
jgi:hypothetical protein